MCRNVVIHVHSCKDWYSEDFRTTVCMCVVGCLVSGKLADGDPLLDIPDPDTGQVAALPSHQVAPVLGPAPTQQLVRSQTGQPLNSFFPSAEGQANPLKEADRDRYVCRSLAIYSPFLVGKFDFSPSRNTPVFSSQALFLPYV